MFYHPLNHQIFQSIFLNAFLLFDLLRRIIKLSFIVIDGY